MIHDLYLGGGIIKMPTFGTTTNFWRTENVMMEIDTV